MEKQPDAVKGTKYRLINDDKEYPQFKAGTIVTLDENDGSSCPFFTVDSWQKEGERFCFYWREIEPLPEGERGTQAILAITPPRFVISWEAPTANFELVTTEKELRSRIKALAEKHSLRRDSIKVYEIKNVRAVTLGTSIKFSKSK